MYELIILVILVAVIVWSIRGGGKLEPVIIHRPGRYHITLAPQLAHVQPFTEQIAARFALSHTAPNGFPSQYFEIRDSQQRDYLLAIAMRGGVLYFQAINPPRAADGRLPALREFSAAVMAQLPLTEPVDVAGAEHLRTAVETVAKSSGAEAKVLAESN